MKATFSFIFFLLVTFSNMSFAARFAEVDVRLAEVFDTLTPGRKVIARLEKGTLVVASTSPTQGFFKVRMRDQSTGWIRVESLKFTGTVLSDQPQGGSVGALTDRQDSSSVPLSGTVGSLNVEVLVTDRLSENLKNWQEMRDTPLSHPFWRR